MYEKTHHMMEKWDPVLRPRDCRFPQDPRNSWDSFQSLGPAKPLRTRESPWDHPGTTGSFQDSWKGLLGISNIFFISKKLQFFNYKNVLGQQFVRIFQFLVKINNIYNLIHLIQLIITLKTDISSNSKNPYFSLYCKDLFNPWLKM